jgi:hypothetical protein
MSKAAPTAPPGAFRTIANAMAAIVNRADVNSRRMASIEDRLAKLDDGPNAELAKQMAFDAVNIDRDNEGKKALVMKRPTVAAPIVRRIK